MLIPLNLNKANTTLRYLSLKLVGFLAIQMRTVKVNLFFQLLNTHHLHISETAELRSQNQQTCRAASHLNQQL